MARDFSKNVSNYLSMGANALSPLVSGAAQVTLSAWVNADTFNTGANDNRIVSALITSTTTSGISFSISGSPAKVRALATSEVGGTAQAVSGTTTVTTGVWHHCAAVIDFAGDAITVYLDGSSDGTGGVAFVSTSYTPGTPTGNDFIGAVSGGVGTPASTAIQFDGRIAEVAMWPVALSAGEIGGLGRGVNPLRVRPGSLVFYMPLHGIASPERNFEANTPAGTITGSVPQIAHAPVAAPFGGNEDWSPYAVAGAFSGPVMFHSHYVNQGWR